MQLFSGDADAVGSCGSNDNADGDDGRDLCEFTRESATALSGSGVGWRALPHRLQEEKEPSTDVTAGSERGWVGLAERMQRRFFRRWIANHHLDGHGYCHIGDTDPHDHLYSGSELKTCSSGQKLHRPGLRVM